MARFFRNLKTSGENKRFEVLAMVWNPVANILTVYNSEDERDLKPFAANNKFSLNNRGFT